MSEIIKSIFPEYLIFSLGWTFIHSMWQSALVAVALKGIYLIIPTNKSGLNYYISIFAITFILALSIRTFKDELSKYSSQSVNVSSSISFDEELKFADTSFLQINSSSENLSELSINRILNNSIPIIFILWLFGFLLKSISSYRSLYEISLIKKSGIELNDQSLENRFHKMSNQLDLSSSIKIMKSPMVKMPSVIGYSKPVILLPMEILTNIPKDQIEIIIAHELAHIYRSDYLLNLFQVFMETIFFFNPAIWWISDKTRDYREYCCDDIALELTGNKRLLAKALFNLAEVSNASTELALTFGKNKNQLLGRIKRMNITKQSKMQSITGTLVLVLLATIMISAAKSDFARNNEISKHQIEEQIPNLENNYIHDKPGKLIFYAKHNGKRVKWEVEVDKNQNIISLFIDDNEIDSDEYADYEETIFNKINELDDEDSGYYFDSEKFAKEMENLQENLSNINANFHFDQEEFEENMKRVSEELKNIDININFDELNKNLQNIKVNFDKEKFTTELEEATEALENMNIDVNIDTDKLRESIRNIKLDFDSEKLNESMKELNEKLKDLDIKMEDLEIEMKKLSGFLEEVKEELVSDNLIEDKDEHFSMILSEDEFIINDEKQPNSLHEKYKDIYESHYDKKLESQIKID